MGTAGGLLLVDADTATLLTPLAVSGDSEQQIASELERLLNEPDSELQVRAALGRLEGRILSELRPVDTSTRRQELLRP